jgi:hypothetical protein
MQQQMHLLQTFMGNQMPILMATQTGVVEVTVGLQGVAAEGAACGGSCGIQKPHQMHQIFSSQTRFVFPPFTGGHYP